MLHSVAVAFLFFFLATWGQNLRVPSPQGKSGVNSAGNMQIN